MLSEVTSQIAKEKNQWKKQLLHKFKACISPEVLYLVHQKLEQYQTLLLSFCCWKWRVFQFNLSDARAGHVRFLGNPDNQALLMSLLGVTLQEKSAVDTSSQYEIRINDFPLPNTITVPSTLNTIVSLNRPVEDIMATYSRSLRRSILAQRSQYRHETVLDGAQIAMLDNDMLQPYARARHERAHQLASEAVQQLAHCESGRLDALYFEGEAIGCHLGNRYIKQGKKHWHVNRFGYIPSIFLDHKRLGEVNSMNLHLALEKAIDDGDDFCDYGMSLARPGAGLIEWKRRRKGFLAKNNGINFHMDIPKKIAAQFFWHSPLFGLENHEIVLHLGIATEKTDEEVIAHHHEMGYGGLSKVYLYAHHMPSDALIQSFHALYADQAMPPVIVTHITALEMKN